ncbi:MAG: methylenetetrahydrofolate--tRNA-(uracil(54)-C(5))-methyltransferase (FADH(2)-oxidizing) TrmFO [Myxococcota bacterium]
MTSKTKQVRVIGGGLAGCEAAWQLANAGLEVELCEMKPVRRTPAQVSDGLAELVCSNSFRSAALGNAVGLVKEEMRRAGGFLMRCAEEAKVPAGDALAVDREHFSGVVEAALLGHPNIHMTRAEVTSLPDDGTPTVVCTGPLTADALAADIARRCGRERLAFYDAIAPIVEADSVDMSRAFFKSRYGKGEGTDYLNCPMTKEEFDRFFDALTAADLVTAKAFEDLHYFEGCLPLEVMASRGRQTLTFGPMKPVGLEHPETQQRFHAVLQLRKEDVHGTAYNMVGCQTRLRQPAQREVFRLIPGLESATFLRFGAIHRNTYLDAPALLDEWGRLATVSQPVFFAGQITGVEGYVESTASGLLVAWLVTDWLAGRSLDVPPVTTMLGGLYRHVRGELRADPTAAYSPSNVTWAMVPPIEKRAPKAAKRELMAQRSLDDLDAWLRARSASGRYRGEQASLGMAAAPAFP